MLATSGRSILGLWDVATGREAARLVGHMDVVSHPAFTPDGRRAVTTSLDGTVRVWDVAALVGA